MSQKSRIDRNVLQATLKGYRARLERDYSNNKRHVYFSRPLQKWIVVRPKGKTQVELEFTDECPCGTDD